MQICQKNIFEKCSKCCQINPKNCQSVLKISPKWRNFAKSDCTLLLSVQLCSPKLDYIGHRGLCTVDRVVASDTTEPGFES